MKVTKILFLWFVLLFSISGVFAQEATPAAGDARIRFAHLSADAPNIDIYVADELVAEAVAFGSVGDYLTLAAGIQAVTLVPTGEALENALINTSVELIANRDYTFGVIGLMAEDTFQRVLIDETSLLTDNSPGMAHVLFLHAMSGVAPVDARVEGSDQRFASGLEFGGYELNTVSPGEYPVVVSLNSDTSVILLDQLNPVTLQPNQLYFVVAVNAPDEGEVDIIVKVTGTLTIGELIINADSFSTLRALIEAAGLTDQLNRRAAEPLTVFAPTDEALAAAFEALGLEPGALLDAPEFLSAILNYHLVPGIFTADDLAETTTIPTLAGTEIQISQNDDGVFVLNGGATITQSDILASNGVIHIIDALLIPPAQ